MLNWLREQRYLWFGGPMPQHEMVRVDTRFLDPETEAYLRFSYTPPRAGEVYSLRVDVEPSARDRFFALLNMEQGHENEDR